VHPSQVSTWKRQAVEGLKEVFSSGRSKHEKNHEAMIRDLHAKIGELTVERDFFLRGLQR
jgi:transposase